MKTQLEELKERLKSIAEQIAVIESKYKPWKPEIGEVCYDTMGNYFYFINNEICNYLLTHGLIFRTLEDQNKWSKVAQIGKRIKDAVMEGNAMFESEEYKLYIIDKSAQLDWFDSSDNCGYIIETTSVKSAEHVIATIGKEDIIYYLKNWM